ncbi:MAG: hypothetical protein AAF490_28250 [Chloroflexota bacterium]
MAKKQKKSVKQEVSAASENPLDQVEELNIKELGPTRKNGANTTAVSSRPISPLGPPQIIEKPTLNGPAVPNTARMHELTEQIEALESELTTLKRANKRLEKRNIELETAVKLNHNLEDNLEQERQQRLEAERTAAASVAQLESYKQISNQLETVRAERLTLEKKVSSLEVRAERTQEVAAMLQQERDARQKLEKEKASLDVQVESLKKLDTLLAEERQARMNAQSRAASAEAQLARLEGELKNNGGSGSRGSLLDRLRGR